MSKTPLALLTAVLLAPACMPPPPEAQATPPTNPAALARVTAAAMGFVESVDYVGTGCSPETVSTAISPDKQAVTSIFSAFVAAADPNGDPDLAARNCLMTLRINVPAGWSYSLESVDYRGFAGLEEEVRASRRSLYLISGSDAHVTPVARFTGPVDENFNHPDVGPEKPGRWSACGGGQLVWIATQTEVNNSEDEDRGGQLALDSIDTELQWRRCE
jgi:hypothetical protein